MSLRYEYLMNVSSLVGAMIWEIFLICEKLLDGILLSFIQVVLTLYRTF